jgi:hypothetical protein
MINKTQRRIAINLFVLVTLSICLIIFLRADLRGAGGQARQKVIEKARTANEVVQFSEIKVSQKAVEPGKTFDDDDDEWAGKIYLKVKNISDKPIVYLAVNINFPETRATGAMMSYPIVLGQMPGSKFPQFHDPIFLLPGESLDIPVTQNHEKMKSFVEKGMPFRNIGRVELEIGFVVFADKTAWSAGVFKRQNAKNPDRYDPISPGTRQ